MGSLVPDCRRWLACVRSMPRHRPIVGCPKARPRVPPDPPSTPYVRWRHQQLCFLAGDAPQRRFGYHPLAPLGTELHPPGEQDQHAVAAEPESRGLLLEAWLSAWVMALLARPLEMADEEEVLCQGHTVLPRLRACCCSTDHPPPRASHWSPLGFALAPPQYAVRAADAFRRGRCPDL